MIDIRPAQAADLQSIQQANIANLPENYVFKFILYHGITWPQGSFVAVYDGRVVGYVLAKLEDEENDKDEEKKDENKKDEGKKGDKKNAEAKKSEAKKSEAKKSEEAKKSKKRIGAHITSIAVDREFRRHGIARQLLEQSLKSLKENYHAECVSLHVRKSNQAALQLYKSSLHFDVKEITSGYYADGEDAYAMEKKL